LVPLQCSAAVTFPANVAIILRVPARIA
jgi:hypothetical protein